MGYKDLTKEQRYTIEALLLTLMSLREIGEVIGISTGTVSREISRHCDMRAASAPMAAGSEEVREGDEGEETLPEVHR